ILDGLADVLIGPLGSAGGGVALERLPRVNRRRQRSAHLDTTHINGHHTRRPGISARPGFLQPAVDLALQSDLSLPHHNFDLAVEDRARVEPALQLLLDRLIPARKPGYADFILHITDPAYLRCQVAGEPPLRIGVHRAG